MENKRTDSYISLFFGVALILAGLGFLLDQLNVYDFSYWFSRLWPLLIFIPALISLITNWKFQWVTSTILLAVATFLLARNFGFVSGDLFFWFWRLFWPVVLILSGISFIVGHNKMGNMVEGNPEDKVNLFVLFGGNKHVSTSKNFVGGQTTAIFGGIELDLRDAEFADGAQMNVMAVMGGIDMKLPKNVKVVMTGMPVFGGFSDSTKTEGENTKVLNIYCTAIFGGVDVKN